MADPLRDFTQFKWYKTAPPLDHANGLEPVPQARPWPIATGKPHPPSSSMTACLQFTTNIEYTLKVPHETPQVELHITVTVTLTSVQSIRCKCNNRVYGDKVHFSFHQKTPRIRRTFVEFLRFHYDCTCIHLRLDWLSSIYVACWSLNLFIPGVSVRRLRPRCNCRWDKGPQVTEH